MLLIDIGLLLHMLNLVEQRKLVCLSSRIKVNLNTTIVTISFLLASRYL